MIATVIYPKRATFQLNVPDECAGKPVDSLSWIWEHSQAGIYEDENKLTELDKQNKNFGGKLRSSMVGDIIILERRIYMVGGVGWLEISPEQMFQLQRAEDVDRLMGWDWMHKRGIVTGEAVAVE